MDLNNLYNFKNAVRHFVDIDSLQFPTDIENFSTIERCIAVRPCDRDNINAVKWGMIRKNFKNSLADKYSTNCLF